jgi:serine phosphatase RsbU (regulator of sigma subunit)
MGHGMRAALVTAILRGLVEQLMPITWDAGKLLTDVNHSLHTILRRTDQPMMSTAFYMVIDCASSEFQFANAGHPSPLRVRRGDGTVTALRKIDARHGPALGLFGESIYPTCRCPVESGDAILIFTDGLYEANAPNDEEYGLDRLLRAVKQRVQLPIPRLFDELLQDVQTFTGTAEFHDDVCLLGVELTQRCDKVR